jgi:predicted ATPase
MYSCESLNTPLLPTIFCNQDEASLSIIDEIVAGADTSKHVLIVLIRRCESDSAEDVPTRLVHREHSVVAGLCSRITSIEVGNLTCQQTNEWISALTRLPEDDTMDLARVVYKKTGGHAFFIEQFLDMLRATRLLTYSPTQMNWIWCLASIEAETYSTDNVVDLVLGRIMRLPIHIRCILTLASCLGYSFDIGWLKLLVHAEFDSEFNTLPNLSTILCEDDMPLLLVNYEDNLSEILSTAVEEGMIENDSRKPNKWKFVHDKVASVLYSMVPTTSSSREILHSRIGRIFLRSIKGKTKAEQSIIFLAAEQLNRGSSTLRVADSKEKLVLSLLNLQTAQLAATKSAFLLAANYLKEGVAQLDPITTWNEHYQLSLQLVSSSARMELIAGNFEESARMVEIVLTHASTLEDKLPAYKIKLQLLSAQSRLREAIEVGFNVLRQLGERIPLKARKVHIILEITRTKIMLTRKSDYDLVSIPQTTNKDCVNVLDFLATMAICTYMKSTAQNTFMLVCLRLMNLSVRHGLAKTSVYGFTGYAMLQGFLGNHDQAYRFANLTFALLDRLDAKEQAPQVIFSLNLGVTHWCQPFRMVFDCLERCYSLGRQVGDIDTACRASMLFTNTAFHCGMSLPVIEEKARKSCHEMFRLQQHFTMRLLLPLWQCVLNLAGENGNDPSILSGEAMELASGLSHIPEEDSHFFNQLDCYFSLVLAYSFENLAKAVILLKELEEKYKSVPGNYSEYTRAFMYGMTYHALYRRDNLRAHKRAARALLRKFDRWTKDGVLNAVPSYLLLKAMDLSLSGNTREVRKAFDAAIAAAAESGFLFHQALANEKAFEALRSMGNYASAEGYLVSSIDLYETYGAHAKVRWLEERNDRSCHCLSPPKVIDVGNTVAVLRI